MNLFLLIAFIVSCTGFLYVTACFVIKFYSEKLLPWCEAGSVKIVEQADLAGIEFNPAVARHLSLFGPVPIWVLKLLRSRRLIKIGEALPDMLVLLGNALKSGLSLPQAVEMASIELKGAIGAELTRVMAQLKLGRTMEEAFSIFQTRIPIEDADLIVQSIEVLRKTGGNLIETFAILSSTIEGRKKVKDRIRTITAQGVYQSIVLLVMPWALGIILYLISPDYMEPLVATRLGIAMILSGVIMELGGAFWLWRIVIIKV